MKGIGKHKRIIAMLLVLAMGMLCLFGGSRAYAAPETGSTSSGSSSSDDGKMSSGGVQPADPTSGTTKNVYAVTPDAAKSYSAYKNLDEWRNREVFTAPANTYVLTVATGSRAGDSVLYFGVRYKGKDGVSRSQYIFPGIDADSRSTALLTHYAKGKDLSDTFGKKQLEQLGYKEVDVKEAVLGAWTVQDFAFQTESEIQSVESIDVYLSRGRWTVQGMSLYKMTSYKGYEEYGLVSGQKFLDFEGYLIADLVKKNTGVLSLSTNGTDSVIRVGGEDSNYCDLQNYASDSMKREYATSATSNDLFTIRVDFSDVLGAGIEAFLNPKAKKLSDDLGIVEDMTMEFQYRDSKGWTRKVCLPVILSTYIQAKLAEPRSAVLGIGQRGDTIAFQGLLPGFQTLLSEVTVKVGNPARSALEANGISIAKASTAMNTALSETQRDEIHLAGVSIYKGGCMPYVRGGVDTNGTHLEGAMPEYAFEGTPMHFYTITEETGRIIPGGGQVKLSLSPYKQGASLVAVTNGRGMYLVTLYTSDKPHAGTTGDVAVRLYYEDMDGRNTQSMEYRAIDGAEQLMGRWPATDGKSYIGKESFKEGGSVSFLVDTKDVAEFTGADIHLIGNDEWEMSNLTISYVDKYSPRRVYLTDGSTVSGTNYWMDRSIVAAEIFNLARINTKVYDDTGEEVDGDGKPKGEKKQLVDENGYLIFDSNGDPVYEDQDTTGTGVRISGEQLFTGDQSLKFDFGDGIVSDVRDLDYSEVIRSMTHEQTGIDWGFFKKKKAYDIGVLVAKDSEMDLGNGDAGSVNYFYFQLVFTNGHSAYVLANQQLAGDAFRSGQEESFTIWVNRDYGDIEAIRIIPEDLASDSTPFDKLNIERITITERTNGGTYLSYVVDSVGWIDIDYRDEAEKGSETGLRPRMEGELSKVFQVTGKERAVKLLCEISTLPWEGNLNQFQGSVRATVEYVSAKDNQIHSKSFDVVQCLAAYMNKTATSMEVATDPSKQTVSAGGSLTISDPEWMFRPSKTDRFVMPPIADLKSIKSITFYCQTRNNESAYLNFGKVTISQVIEDGQLHLTANDEYYREMKTKRLCVNRDDKTFSKLFPLGVEMPMETIYFTENELVWTSDAWATPVARIPVSMDDSVNIFVYPTVYSKSSNVMNVNTPLETHPFFVKEEQEPAAYEGTAAEVHVNLKYNVPYSQMMATSANLRQIADAEGHPMFYATGIRTNDFTSAASLAIQCSAPYSINKAIVQHVRQGVVLSSYNFSFLNLKATRPTTATPMASLSFSDQTEEKLMISFGEGTPTQNLQPVNRDIAVSFSYTSSLDGGTVEYWSPYVYLTDQGYTSISEGMFAEIEYDVPFVRQITGYRIAAYGSLKGVVSGSAGMVYNVDKVETDVSTGDRYTAERSKRNYVSFRGSYDLSDQMQRREATSTSEYGENSLTPIELKIATADISQKQEGREKTSVRAKITYRDHLGTSRVVTFKDLTNYIQGDTEFSKDETHQTVKFFLADMAPDMTVQSVEFVPYNAAVKVSLPEVSDPFDGSTAVMDELVKQLQERTGHFAEDSSDAATLLPQVQASRDLFWSVDEVVYRAGEDMKPIAKTIQQTFNGLENGGSFRLNSITLTTYVQKNGIQEGQVKAGTKRLVAVPGDVISGSAVIGNSSSGFTAKASRLYYTVNDETGATGIYEKDVTSETLAVNPNTLSYSFTVPKNTEGKAIEYKIEIYPVDAEDLKDVIYITVESVAINLETSYTMNGGEAVTVQNHTVVLTAKPGDELIFRENVLNSLGGITVGAYLVNGDSSTGVTSKTVSNLTPTGFVFTVPENKTGNVMIYKIEISPTEEESVIDTIMLTVESDPVPEEPPEETGEETQDENADQSADSAAPEDSGSQTEPPKSNTPERISSHPAETVEMASDGVEP